MNAGFGKIDITPRLGVEMSGFGPYVHRVARELRDFLYARAIAVDDGRDRWVLVSCDLVGVDSETVAEARQMIARRTGLADRQIMIHCTHTHSGPATCSLFGWGEQDGPYMERLASHMAAAAAAAVENLRPARFLRAETPAEGIAYNRETDERPAYEDALREGWRPTRPGDADPIAHVIRIESDGRLTGFLSSFSCHPVSCCESTHSLHGDYAGVATNMVERDHPGAVGLFLIGAHGDINTAVCHESQERSMAALNVLAGRYARAIRSGLASATPMQSTPVRSEIERVTFRRAEWPAARIESEMAQCREAVLSAPGGESSHDCRLNMVFLAGMRRSLERLQAQGSHEVPADMQALRLGELTLVGTPFELFLGIKRRICREAGGRIVLPLSLTNGLAGYAVTRERFAKADYAASRVPFILGMAPFTADLEDEITESALRLVAAVNADSPA